MNHDEIQARVERLRAFFPSSNGEVLSRFLSGLDNLPAYYDLIPRILEQDVDMFQARLEHARMRGEIPPAATYVSVGVAMHLNHHFPTIQQRRDWIIANLLAPPPQP